MNTRTSILCVSFVALLLTTAVSPPPTDVLLDQRDSVSDLGTSPSPGTEATASPASLEQLSVAYAPGPPASTESVTPPVNVDPPTLWLARAIYSETKLLHEQELVAWVVRNRVETRYRGNSTYREVVLDPYQFSAFNPGSPKRSFLMQLKPNTPLAGWQQALWVAHYVRHAAPVYRPFPIETRHFYSERSMKGRRAPYWAEGSHFVSPKAKRYRYLVDEDRFRFFKQIS